MPSQPEAELQAAIVVALHRHFDCRCLHVPNGGARGKLEAARLKTMGVLAGHPDLIVYGIFQVFLIEVKAKVLARDRDVPPQLRFDTLDPAQKRVVTDLRRRGHTVFVVDSVAEALAAGEAMKLPPAASAPRPAPEATGL